MPINLVESQSTLSTRLTRESGRISGLDRIKIMAMGESAQSFQIM